MEESQRLPGFLDVGGPGAAVPERRRPRERLEAVGSGWEWGGDALGAEQGCRGVGRCVGVGGPGAELGSGGGAVVDLKRLLAGLEVGWKVEGLLSGEGGSAGRTWGGLETALTGGGIPHLTSLSFFPPSGSHHVQPAAPAAAVAAATIAADPAAAAAVPPSGPLAHGRWPVSLLLGAADGCAAPLMSWWGPPAQCFLSVLNSHFRGGRALLPFDVVGSRMEA